MIGNEEIIYFNVNTIQMVVSSNITKLEVDKTPRTIFKFDMEKCHLFDKVTKKIIEKDYKI